MKNAFTMIELVFVIVVLGILAGVAVPKFAASRVDAQISKARADISSIRSSIITERQTRLIKGDSVFISKLHSSATDYFDGNGSSTLLMYAIAPQDEDGHWLTGASCDNNEPENKCTYKFKVNGVENTFQYTQEDGKFLCTGGSYCTQLTK